MSHKMIGRKKININKNMKKKSKNLSPLKVFIVKYKNGKSSKLFMKILKTEII